MLREQITSLNLRDTLSKLSNHTSTKLAKQADTVMAVLSETA